MKSKMLPRQSFGSRHRDHRLLSYFLCLTLLTIYSGAPVARAETNPSPSDLLNTAITSKDQEPNQQKSWEQYSEGSMRNVFAKKPIIDEVATTQNNEASPLTQIKNRPDEDLLILTLKLSGVTLLDVLLAYEDLDTETYYIPLTDFFEVLEFPIDVNLDQRTASGWFLDENRSFSLDLSKAQAVSAGQKFSLSSKDIELHKDGVYVSLQQLEQWFPVTFDLDFNNLALIIKSLEPLPIEIRLARDEQRESGVRSSRLSDNEHPLQKTPAPLFSIPFINTSTQLSYDNSDIVDKSLTGQLTTLASGIVAGQDFLFSLNENTADDQGANIRASIGLKDPDQNLFGIGGSEYLLGDVVTQSIPLLSTGLAGRGFSFSTMPLDTSSASQSGTIQLRGELPVGYQVDAMRNGQLLGFRETPDQNGEYLFDLDALPGLNVFELVFYGPQGQRDVREERIYVSDTPVKKGQFGYKTEVIQDNTNLFTNRKTNDEDQGKYRFSAQAEYGITDTSSIYTALADLSIDGIRRLYSLLRYSQSFNGIRTDLSYAKNNDSGQAASMRVQGVFRGLRWRAQHDYYNRFISEETERVSLQGELKHATSLRLSGLLPLFKTAPFTLNLNRVSNTEGMERVTWQARVTKNIKKLRITSSLDQEIEDEQERETDLNIQISSRFENISLRGNVGYEIEPEPALENLSLTADWRVSDKTTLRALLRRTGSEDPVHTITLGASHNLDTMRLGFNLSYDDDDEIRALLSSSFSFGYDPYENTAFMQGERLAKTAMFAPRVFYDKNSNNVFDENDEWMENITFAGNNVDKDSKTNESGYTLLTGITPYTRNSLELNTSSLPDPFMRSTVPPQDYILRPGQTITPVFSVVLVGETDGNIELVKNGSKHHAQSINVQIVNPETQHIITEGKSEYDGFIWLQDIPMGTHIVRIDPEQASKLGYCIPATQKIVIRSDEPFTSFDNFLLWPKGSPERFDIILSRQAGKSEAKAIWNIIASDIYQLFEGQEYVPYSYVITSGAMNSNSANKPYMLLLQDLDESASRKVCDTIRTKTDVCEIIESEKICADSVYQIEQLNENAMRIGQDQQDETKS